MDIVRWEFGGYPYIMMSRYPADFVVTCTGATGNVPADHRAVS